MRGFGYEPGNESEHYQVRIGQSGLARLVHVAGDGTVTETVGIHGTDWRVIGPIIADAFNVRLPIVIRFGRPCSADQGWLQTSTPVRLDLGRVLIDLVRRIDRETSNRPSNHGSTDIFQHMRERAEQVRLIAIAWSEDSEWSR